MHALGVKHDEFTSVIYQVSNPGPVTLPLQIADCSILFSTAWASEKSSGRG
jgi:hypothetical protein